MLKKKLEALLFSSGRKMSIEELSRLTNTRTGDIQKTLEELKQEYDNKDSSVMIVNEGDSWKLTVKEEFLPLVQKIITETELSKTVVETLAVIAFKYPIKQSELIKIRTNKAYDHLKELEQMGYISRQKHGRTNLIKLTQKFFEYFDLREEQLKEKFRDFSTIAKAIEDKEQEIETIKQNQKAQAEEEKQKTEEINKEVDLLGEEGQKIPLESYEKDTKPEEVKDKLGDLEVVDEPSEEKLEEERERLQKIKEEDKKKKEEPKFEGTGVKLSKEDEKKVDEKVEKILHPEEEPKETENEEQKENKSSEEPKDLLDASMEEKKKEEK